MAEPYVSSDVGDALSKLLTGGKGAPRSLEEAFELYGPTARQQNPALARELVGLPATGKLPELGTPERTRYETAKRALQRYRAAGTGRQSRPGRALGRQVLPRARRARAAPYVRRVRREGLRMRLVAELRVSRTWRVSIMPADTGAGVRFQYIGPGQLREVLRTWLRGEEEVGEAAALLLEEFFRAYWAGDPDPAEVGEITSCSLRFGGDE